MKPPVGRVGDPCVMVIFGYAGDLTRRKLIPALYNLASQQLLSREFAVIGMGRTPMSNEEARKKYSPKISRSSPPARSIPICGSGLSAA